MSNNYYAMSKVESLLSNVSKQAFKELDKQDPKDIKAKTNTAAVFDFRTEFEHIVDKELYGNKKDDYVFGTVGIRLAKVMNHIGRFVTTMFLGGNIHSATVNLLTGYNEIVKEAGVGEYINKKDLVRALYNYIHHV
jgi:hypothetical protein